MAFLISCGLNGSLRLPLFTDSRIFWILVPRRLCITSSFSLSPGEVGEVSCNDPPAWAVAFRVGGLESQVDVVDHRLRQVDRHSTEFVRVVGFEPGERGGLEGQHR